MKALGVLLIFLTLMVPMVAAIEGGLPDRLPGVGVGTQTVYFRDLFGLESILTLTVTGINQSTIYYDWTEYFPASNLTFTTNLWTNVDAQVIITAINGTVYADDTQIGVSHYYVAGGLLGGSEYKGSPLVMQTSLFGKILLGNWRATQFYKEEYVNARFYMEWDRETGILTEWESTYYGAGTTIRLISTNAWETGLPLWVTVGAIVGGLVWFNSKVVPWLGLFVLLWFLSFLPIRIKDWAAVKHARGSGGSIIPPWLKMIMVSALVFIFMWIAVMFILGLILR